MYLKKSVKKERMVLKIAGTNEDVDGEVRPQITNYMKYQ